MGKNGLAEEGPRAEERREVELAVGGDLDAFERLYRQHLPYVNRLAVFMLASTDVDDAVQDIFVRAWVKLNLFRGESSFRTWLRRLAINIILRRRHGPSRTINGQAGMIDELPAKEPLHPGLSQLDWKADLTAAVGTLPERARLVFVLHDVEGYKHTEIASLLEISPSTSRAQLHRARMLLRSFLTNDREKR